MYLHEHPKALYRVRFHERDDEEGTYREFIVDNMTQVKNMQEIHRVFSVDVAVPVWAPLNSI